MLAQAKNRVPTAHFLEGGIANFAPLQRQDLLLANASIHWLPRHAELLPQLMQTLTAGGVLALQMPNNLNEPSHRLMEDVASLPVYAKHLKDFHSERGALLSTREYYDCLIAHSEPVHIWETRYQHILEGHKSIVEWFKSTGLKPYLDMLPPEKRKDFEADYLDRIGHAYPRLSDGKVMLSLPRLFIVARRAL